MILKKVGTRLTICTFKFDIKEFCAEQKRLQKDVAVSLEVSELPKPGLFELLSLIRKYMVRLVFLKL